MRRSVGSLKRLQHDPLNGGSSMTLGCKGKLHPRAHRMRMPWTASREPTPSFVLFHRDKTILEGKHNLDAEDIDRLSQPDPLEVLDGAVAQRRYLTSTGHTLFQLASQAEGDGRGQIFYRREWKEGTYDKHITLSSVEFDRDGTSGTAYGYITFHGESTLRPVKVDNAHVPGWVMEYDASRTVAAHQVVAPPPSIGTDVPVDVKRYRLKSYPYYDPPNPPEFVERLLRERGILPDPPRAEGSTLPVEETDDPTDTSIRV